MGAGAPSDPVIVETEKVVRVPGPERIVEVPVPIVSAAQEEDLERLTAENEDLQAENEFLLTENANLKDQVVEASERTTQTVDVQTIAKELGCFEDEHVVLIAGVVQPDDGVEPNVDWAGTSEPAGSYGCATADDFRGLFPGE
jgi:hypothetical protein